jgi:hypothetical protein
MHRKKSSSSQELTGILEENEKSELRSMGGKADEQDGVATHNEGYSINPCVACPDLKNGRVTNK